MFTKNTTVEKVCYNCFCDMVKSCATSESQKCTESEKNIKILTIYCSLYTAINSKRLQSTTQSGYASITTQT